MADILQSTIPYDESEYFSTKGVLWERMHRSLLFAAMYKTDEYEFNRLVLYLIFKFVHNLSKTFTTAKQSS